MFSGTSSLLDKNDVIYMRIVFCEHVSPPLILCHHNLMVSLQHISLPFQQHVDISLRHSLQPTDKSKCIPSTLERMAQDLANRIEITSHRSSADNERSPRRDRHRFSNTNSGICFRLKAANRTPTLIRIDWLAIDSADQKLLLSFTGIDGIIHDILESLDVLIAEDT